MSERVLRPSPNLSQLCGLPGLVAVLSSLPAHTSPAPCRACRQSRQGSLRSMVFTSFTLSFCEVFQILCKSLKITEVWMRAILSSNRPRASVRLRIRRRGRRLRGRLRIRRGLRYWSRLSLDAENLFKGLVLRSLFSVLWSGSSAPIMDGDSVTLTTGKPGDDLRNTEGVVRLSEGRLRKSLFCARRASFTVLGIEFYVFHFLINLRGGERHLRSNLLTKPTSLHVFHTKECGLARVLRYSLCEGASSH